MAELKASLDSIRDDLLKSIKLMISASTSPSRQALNDILKVSQRLDSLSKMTEELVIMRSLENGDLKPERKLVDSWDLLQIVHDKLSQTSREMRKPLCLEKSSGATVEVDSELILRVLETLLSVAIDHGQPNKLLMVYHKVMASTVVIHVVTQGCKERKDRCPCPRILQGGMEIRLNFCSRAAWANLGWTNITSMAGQGLDLSLTLPIAAADN